MTTFRSVIDRATTLLTDYRLDNLYKTDTTAFYSYMEGFLLNSIDMFNGCLTDLSYSSVTIGTVTENQFNNTLSSKEVYILALGIAISWMEKNTKDIVQMNLHLNTREFKSFSEANSLKVKQESLDIMREDFNNEITKYQLKNLTKLVFFNGGN